MKAGDTKPSALAVRLGRLIQDQRYRQQLTQERLAAQVDLSHKYVGEVERGEANVTVMALERIAEALGWQPFGDALAPVSSAARTLLLNELRGVGHALSRVLAWLETLTLTTNGLVPVSLDDPVVRENTRRVRGRRRVRSRSEKRS